MSRLQHGVNDLYTWCMNNGERGQQLLSEWTGIDENDNQISIGNITQGSHVRMKWRCKEGHQWEAAINQRVSGKLKGCPCCFNENRSNIVRNAKIKQGVNDLYSWCLRNGDYGQLLLEEWVGLDENNRQVDIKSVARGDARRKYLWKCKVCGKKYYSLNNDRTAKLVGCPYCKGNNLKLGINDLYTWCHKNRLFGEQLLQEFGEGNNSQKYINEKGEIKTPRDYSRGTHSRIKWTCNKGHTWNATILSRVHYRTKCPSCSKSQTSYPEQFLFHAIKQIYPNAENRCRVLKSPEHPQGIEFDIGIPVSINGYKAICIEYSSIWHINRAERDTLKAEICKQYNVRFIYIEEHTEQGVEEIWTDNYIRFRLKYYNIENEILHLLRFILKSLGHSIDEIDLESVRKNAYDYSHGNVIFEKSLEYNYPELAKEWHPIKNNVTPAEIASRTHDMFYWQCTKCNYGENGEWYTSPNRRTAKGHETGCPKCGYKWFKGEFGNKNINEIIPGENDLATKLPELAKDWNDSLNKIKSSEVGINSREYIYWTCQKCGYGKNGEWVAKVADRNKSKTGCRQCGYNWFTKTSSKYKEVKNKLIDAAPLLAYEYNSEKSSLSIEYVSATSSTKAYWLCPNCNYGKNEDWICSIANRFTHHSGCPQCGYNWYKAQIRQTQKLKKGYTLNISSESEPVKMLPKPNTITKYNETKL